MPDPITPDPVIDDSIAASGPSSPDDRDAAASKPSRKRRRWLKVVGVAVLLVVVLVALAPSIAGALAPRLIASRVRIPGTIEVQHASLGWFSSQQVGPIIIREKDAKPGSPPIATVTLKASKGLAGLVGAALGSFDFGIIEATGSADIIRHADGSTNIEKALGFGQAATNAPGPTGAPGPAAAVALPRSLSATLNLTGLNVSFTDERALQGGGGGARSIFLDNSTITAAVAGASGGNLTLNFAAKATEGVAGSGPGATKSGNGTVAGVVKANGWLTADGLLTPEQAIFDVNISVSDVPSGIADTLVTSLPGNATITSALGPTIALTAIAKGTRGRLEASFKGVMANVLASADVTIANKSLALNKPLSLHVKGEAARALVPQIAQAMTGGADKDLVLSQLPDVVLGVDMLRLPIDLANPGRIDLRGAAIVASVGTSGQAKGAIRLSTGAEPQAFVAEPLLLRVESTDLAKGATLKGDTSVSIGGHPAGELTIDLAAKGFLDSNGAPAMGVPQMSGSVHLVGASTALAQPFVASSGLDLMKDVGPTLDISIKAASDIATAAVASGGGGASSFNVDVQAKSSEAALVASVHASEKEVKVESVQAALNVSPDTMHRLSPGEVRLTQPVELHAILGGAGFTIPIQSGLPDRRAASPLDLTLSIPRVSVEGLALKGDDGTRRPLGRVSIEDVWGVLHADTAALWPDPNAIPGTAPAGGGVAGKARFEWSSILVGPDAKPLGNLHASASVSMRSGRLEDVVKLGVALDNLSPEVAQSILPPGTIEPGMLQGALGGTIGLALDAAITTPGKELSNLDATNATAKMVLRVSGERVATTKPLTIDVLQDRVALTSPAEIRVSLEPSWVNSTFLAAEAPPTGGTSPAANAKALTMLEPAWIAIALNPLSIARPAGTGQNAVGVLNRDLFRLGMDLHVPRVVLRQADGKRLEAIDLSVKAVHPPDATDGTINAALTGKIGAAGTGGEPATLAPLNLAISISQLATPNGELDLAHTFMNVSGDLPKFPSSLLDLFAHQDGSLAEFVGDTADIRVKAQNVSLAPGTKGPLENTLLDASVNSPRVSVAVAGRVVDNAFVASAPIELQVTELTPKAGQFINAAIPALGTIEKRAGQDRPAKVTITDFRYPLDGKYETLAGALVVDPGEARFATSTAFGEILKLVKQQTEGTVGRRLEPLAISIVGGTIAFPKYKLILGEFTLETEGSINVATRSINIVTWIPFGALSDKIAGTVKLNTGLGSAIGRVLPIEGLSMIPFRTTGTFDKNATTLDAELMAKSLVDTVRPDKVIQRIPGFIGDLIPDIGGKKDTSPQTPGTPPK